MRSRLLVLTAAALVAVLAGGPASAGISGPSYTVVEVVSGPTGFARVFLRGRNIGTSCTDKKAFVLRRGNRNYTTMYANVMAALMLNKKIKIELRSANRCRVGGRYVEANAVALVR